MAMRHRALFAWRSRPRLGGGGGVLPLEAWTGLAPQRAAKEASLRIRCGLSPAAMRRAAAVPGPAPRAPRRAGAAWAQSAVMAVSWAVISVVRAWWRRARARSAWRAAVSGPVAGAGRNRAQAATLAGVPRAASWARSGSGAVMMRSRIWQAAWGRALTAEGRATRSTRSASAGPAPALGTAG